MIDIQEIEKRKSEIPFGNSIFQNENFCVNESPERLYRHCLLQIDAKLDALQEAKFKRDEIEIDIKEAEEKRLNITGYELQRTEIDIERKKYALDKQLKLIKDAEIEVMTHWNKIKDMPVYTRKEFELSEYRYWLTRLISEANSEMKAIGRIEKGTLQSLNKIGIDGIIKNGKMDFIKFKEIENKSIELVEI
jgi:hypothetical protein